jgi:hypothetical protein
MINASESPEHFRIHTLRKMGVSSGEVVLVLGEKRMEVEPYCTYPISGEDDFEALDYYIPFDNVFGPKKPVYDEDAIRKNIETKQFKRLDVTHRKILPGGGLEAVPGERLTGVQLAILGATGYHVIARSAFRTEGASYEERIFNFSIHCPVNGGGMIRIANAPVDIANPTFNPHAVTPKRAEHKDLVLLEAFNRTHKPRTDAIEERRRKRIEEAEANVRSNERTLGLSRKALPGRSDD